MYRFFVAVSRVTSACFKRIKHFKTPLCEFVYYYLSLQKFSAGITWESVDENTHFMIATREKALADTVARLKSFSTHNEMLEYLVEGMRIDADDIFALRLPLMKDIVDQYQNTNVDLLCKILEK